MARVRFTRRSFLQGFGSVALASVAGLPPALIGAETTGAGDAAAGATRTLARYLVTARPEDVPAPVRHEATRTLVNFMGVAIGGSRHESTEMALAAILPFSGAAHAQVLGRRERVDVMHAALLNGISSHVLNFDDTHLTTIVHASSTVVPPALALAEYLPNVSGRQLLHAIVLGMETAFRVGAAVFPNHFDAGWHITGTAGSIGAAAASGRLLGLTELQMTWALGLAASQPVGLRESFGSMNKSFNPGRAAQNGLLAALLAQRNFTSSEQMLEAKSGWAYTLSTKQDFRAMTDELGERFEAAQNTYLPFACGIVIHPAIDGCLRLREKHALRPDAIERVALRVNPRVVQLSGKKTPTTGLEGKFSVYHAAAIALVAGKAGPREFTDEAVRAPETIRLRERVTVEVDRALKETQAGVTIALRGGQSVEVFVEHVVGSLQNPMSDAALEAKALDLCAGILPAVQSRALIEKCWKVESLSAAAELGRGAAAR